MVALFRNKVWSYNLGVFWKKSKMGTNMAAGTGVVKVLAIKYIARQLRRITPTVRPCFLAASGNLY